MNPQLIHSKTLIIKSNKALKLEAKPKEQNKKNQQQPKHTESMKRMESMTKNQNYFAIVVKQLNQKAKQRIRDEPKISCWIDKMKKFQTHPSHYSAMMSSNQVRAHRNWNEYKPFSRLKTRTIEHFALFHRKFLQMGNQQNTSIW